jgi:hypothetical protein
MRESGMTADEAIASFKRGSIRRVFPGELLSKTLDEIEAAERSGSRSASTALKLLFRREYDK